MPMDPDPIAQRDTAKADVADSEELRAWMRTRVARLPRSVNAIERDAGIAGNALGKYLRGEPSHQRMTPLLARRIAPILGVSEESLLARAGLLSHAPEAIGVERAIQADQALDLADKRFLLDFYRRLVALRTGAGADDA